MTTGCIPYCSVEGYSYVHVGRRCPYSFSCTCSRDGVNTPNWINITYLINQISSICYISKMTSRGSNNLCAQLESVCMSTQQTNCVCARIVYQVMTPTLHEFHRQRCRASYFTAPPRQFRCIHSYICL